MLITRIGEGYKLFKLGAVGATGSLVINYLIFLKGYFTGPRILEVPGILGEIRSTQTCTSRFSGAGESPHTSNLEFVAI